MAKAPRRFVLLIGVDFYFAGNHRQRDGVLIKYPHLKGCVKDVSDVKATLEKLFDSRGGCRITTLTATRQLGLNQPTEEDERTWPTKVNILRELNAIAGEVQDGDLVYIHYSGHGITRDLVDVDDGDHDLGTAIVPTDVCTGGAYVSLKHLGVKIRKILLGRENLRVTVVLDCCFSGNGLRTFEVIEDDGGYKGARTAQQGEDQDEFDNTVDDTMLETDIAADREARLEEAAMDVDESNTAEEECAKDDEDETSDCDPISRGVIGDSSWLSRYDGCTTFTACGARETASERKFGRGRETSPNGVLTYLMLECLRECYPKGRATYARVEQHVMDKMRAMKPKPSKQRPTVYGHANFEFFGHRVPYEHPYCRILSVQGDRIELETGTSEGTFTGAVFDIYNENPDAESILENDYPQLCDTPVAQVRIDKAGDFCSKAAILGQTPSDWDCVSSDSSVAVLKSWALAFKMHVKIDSGLDGCSWDAFRFHLYENIITMAGFHLLTAEEDVREDFRVSIDGTEHFEIRDGAGTTAHRLPRIPVNDHSAAKKLGHLLRHLARFDSTKGLSNSNLETSLLPQDFTLQILDKRGNSLQGISRDIYEAKDNQDFCVLFTNNSDRSVYVTFFLFNASWGIEKLYPVDGRAGVEAITSGRVRSPFMTFTIPPKDCDADPSDIVDVVRACIYAGDNPPTWNGLTLPELPLETGELFSEAALEAVHTPGDGDFRKVTKARSQNLDKWLFLDVKVHTVPWRADSCTS